MRNEGTGPDGVPRFVDVAMALGADDIRDARGVAAADYDNDGDLDFVVNHNPGDLTDPEHARAVLLINRIGERNGESDGARRAWLAVDVEGRGGNRDAIGAVVTVEADGVRQQRRVEAGSGYASQHSRRLHFGLGDATVIERLTVRWPQGAEVSFTDLAVRHLVRIDASGALSVGPLSGAVAKLPVEAVGSPVP